MRNSVDHGIETPQIRIRAGKSSEGVIHLRAFHGGGQIHLEVSDDGAGIDPTRVREKAIQRGLITTDHASRMSDSDMVRLAFLPGLSTAEKLSTISGRGVGMDVVRTTIERIGGHVDIRSRIGEGTVLEIRIPMARSTRVLADTA